MQGFTHDVVVGDWYRSGSEPPFEVVAVDADQETIEVQYYDGTLQEIDFDTWSEMQVQRSAPPEDWKGALDLEREDYGVEPETLHADLHGNLLDQIDQMDQLDQLG